MSAKIKNKAARLAAVPGTNGTNPIKKNVLMSLIRNFPTQTCLNLSDNLAVIPKIRDTGIEGKPNGKEH